MLPVGQELIFIQVSHDIWAYYMFKQLPWHACQGHGAIITSKSPIPFLKEGINVCKKPFLGDFTRIKRLLEQMCNTGPSSFASSFRTQEWSSCVTKIAVFPLTYWKKKKLSFFIIFLFYFFSRKEQGQACNFMKIQVFCWGSVLYFFILHFFFW